MKSSSLVPYTWIWCVAFLLLCTSTALGTIAAANTLVLFDYTKTTGPSVVTSSRWTTDYACPKNTCQDGAYGSIEGSIIAPTGMKFAGTTLPYPDSNYLLIRQAPTATYWSDVMFVDPPGPSSVHVKFYSAKDPPSIPIAPNYCQDHLCILETGGVQTVGTITWTDGLGHFVTDTIKFRAGGLPSDSMPVLEGAVLGMRVSSVQCDNLATGQSLIISDGASLWDCVFNGLVVAPGDEVQQTITGFANAPPPATMPTPPTPRPVPPAGVKLRIAVFGPGAVTGPGINCSGIPSGGTGICSSDFTAGDTVTLSAKRDPTAYFDFWDGWCGGSSPSCSITLDADKDVGAIFKDRGVVTPAECAPDAPGGAALKMGLSHTGGPGQEDTTRDRYELLTSVHVNVPAIDSGHQVRTLFYDPTGRLIPEATDVHLGTGGPYAVGFTAGDSSSSAPIGTWRVVACFESLSTGLTEAIDTVSYEVFRP